MITRAVSALRRWASRWPLAGALALVLAGQFFIASAGFWTLRLPDTTRDYTAYYYDWLADAFGQGQLSLLQEPPAGLATLADPYDPAQREGLGAIHDAVYFRGKYYLTWGPVPALLLLGIYQLTGTADIPDSYLTLVFAYGLTLVAAALFDLLREWLFPDAPRWLPAAGLLALGLGSPLLFMLARPAAYEAAILAGQFFLLGGVLAALLAIRARGRRAGLWLVAGAYWALAIGSRWSLFPAAGLLAGVFGLWAWRELPRARARSLPLAAALVGPVVLGTLAMGTYNLRRFGGFFEVGQAYALSGINQHVVAEASRLLAWPRALPAVLDYLAQPLALSRQFPWVAAAGSVAPWWGNQVRDVIREPLVGVLWSAPFALLGLALPALWGRFRRKPAEMGPTESAGLPEARWTAAALAVAVPAVVVPLSLYLTVTMRYMEDFVPLLIVLGYVTAGAVAAHWPRWRSPVLAAAAVLAALSAGIGLLLGFTGHYQHFERHNPSLMAVLRGEVTLECYLKDQRGEPIAEASGVPLTVDDGCPRALSPVAVDGNNAPLQLPAGQWPGYLQMGMNGEASYGPIQVAQGALELALTAQGSIGGGRTPELIIQLRDAGGAAVGEQVVQLPATLGEVRVRLTVPQPGVYTVALLFQDDYFLPGEGDRNVLVYACRFHWTR